MTSKNCVDLFSDDSAHIVLGSMLGYGCICRRFRVLLFVIYFSKEQSWLSGYHGLITQQNGVQVSYNPYGSLAVSGRAFGHNSYPLYMWHVEPFTTQECTMLKASLSFTTIMIEMLYTTFIFSVIELQVVPCWCVSEMTYTVSSGTLNPTIPYHNTPYRVVVLFCYFSLYISR